MVMAISKEKRRILEMVQEGKLTAEEALILLEKLEEDANKEEVKKETLVTELSTKVNWESSSSHKSKTTKTTNVKASILDFVDKAFKKIKDVDLDFNFGASVSVQHIFQHSNVYLTDVDIDVANGSVRLVPWSERDVRVECDAKVYGAESQDEARNTFLQDVVFSIDGGKLRYAVQKKKMKVNATIYLPEASYDSITVRLFNGQIEGEKIRVKEFKAKTANGKITVGSLSTDKFEVETANGHITATDLYSKNVEAETINGTIKLNGSYERADLQSFNGSIIATLDDTKCESLLVKSTTGNVDIVVPANKSIHGDVKTNIGSIQCDLPFLETKEEKSEVVQKYMKFQTKQSSECEPLLIDVETKTGSIVIQEKGASSR